jgi:hypothetical protein
MAIVSKDDMDETRSTREEKFITELQLKTWREEIAWNTRRRWGDNMYLK